MKAKLLAHLGANWINADIDKLMRECRSADGIIVNAFDPNLYRNPKSDLQQFVISDEIYSSITKDWNKSIVVAPYSGKMASKYGYGADGFYIPPGHIGNVPLLKSVAEFATHVFLNVSSAFMEEISGAVEYLIEHGTPQEEITLIYSYPQYPAPLHHLRPMLNIASEFFPLTFGYCDNRDDLIMSVVALSMGVDVIIKTVDTKSKRGIDAHFSITGEKMEALAVARDEFSTKPEGFGSAEITFRKTGLVCEPDYKLPTKG
jgi:sialic acid synthase SpsE